MSQRNAVHVWEEDVEIPTYEGGKPNPNPMFLEKRVYQGSSGKVYPYPVIDNIADAKTMRTYRLVILENEYLRIEVLPEIGGRIYRALDKTNSYDFVYYNRVIKPALVGLAGPWISGGIEFNWPQHHRPNTFGPVEYDLKENKDGSATVWVSEIDRMYGTKVTAGFTLYPGKAYLEVGAQLYNRTPEPQTFLWWANPAVAVNEKTQSVFPPDVRAVFDHGKRDVSRFPIATGTYYKVDYSEGVDISCYKNIPVPTSYMAYQSNYDFMGGYDHGMQAGLLHVADHHISPGKKQWTWGCGDFGKAWDRNLTDEDGPYVELMTGVYTDNQPDFTWIQPYEEKSFKQYFMPYKEIGMVKNATVNAAVNLKIEEETHTATVMVYATSVFEDVVIQLKGREKIYLNATEALSPEQAYQTTVKLEPAEEKHDLRVSIIDARGVELVSYQPEKPEIKEMPEPAKPLPLPEAFKTNEKLFLAGMHLEQYRHATFKPEDYYLEGLKRDPDDSRINLAYGRLLLRRGLFKDSESYFRKAIESLTWLNPNPYDGEPHYQMGISLRWQGRSQEAFDAFYKSTWSGAWQDSGYFSLAQIACEKGDFTEALEFVEESLNRNARHYKARNLKTMLLRKLRQFPEARKFAEETIQLDVADFAAYNELYLILSETEDKAEADHVIDHLRSLMRGDVHNYLNLAADYAECGLNLEAIQVLGRIVEEKTNSADPMLHYTLGYLYEKSGSKDKALNHLKAGKEAAPDYCFPNTLFELVVLENAITADDQDSRAHYYLGNLLYDKNRYVDATAHWEASRGIDSAFSTVHRNLALAYYNKYQEPEKSRECLEKAFACDPTDARVLYELDQLYKKLRFSPEKRLEHLKNHEELVVKRDDLYLEYVTLLNTMEHYKQAVERLVSRKFHPWEGGEGKVTAQYVLAHVELGKRFLRERAYQEAVSAIEKALHYPENLGEGKLAGAQENNIYYYLGCAYQSLGDEKRATHCFQLASEGLEEPDSPMFYNDQPPDMIFYQGLAWLKLGHQKEAKRRFHKLVDYGEKHLFDEVEIDYFAVSLPDFLIFDEDLNQRNEGHCRYMMALGLIGFHKSEAAKEQLYRVLRLDPNHQGARIHLQMCK